MASYKREGGKSSKLKLNTERSTQDNPYGTSEQFQKAEQAKAVPAKKSNKGE